MLLALLIAWAVTSGGGNGDHHDDSKPPSSGPAGSITPGPSGSGPAITEQPGGSGESDGSGGSGGDKDGSSGGGSAGTGGSSGSSDANGGGQDTGSGSASGSTGSGTGEGAQAARPVPAGSSLADCTAGAIRISLKTELSYAPDEKPKFRLFVTNTSSTACKADFGPKSAVLTVTEAGGDDDEVWSSKDCPRDPKPALIEVPAGTTVVHTVQWDRAKSAPKCATPPPGKAKPGTYLVEAKAPGQPVQRASFVLAKD
ncbi:hypothetical protein ACFZAT_14875 [Streptomyces sp. NPDC008163]|uniref:hypothetical protein n=1 Tax=Streptomyces sp. NPDC008163 TaxID=3364818 RepID=UPI0036E596ED